MSRIRVWNFAGGFGRDGRSLPSLDMRRSNGCRRQKDRHQRRRNAGGDDEAASAPSVEDSEETEFCAQMLGIGGDGAQAAWNCSAQNAGP